MRRSRIEYSDAPADVMKRLVAGTRKGVGAAAQHFDDSILPEHFEDGAAEEFGFAKRSGEGEPAYVPSVRGFVIAGGKSSKYGKNRVRANPRYFHKKAREGFGTKALVRTGQLKQQALAGGRVSSRVKGSTVEATDSISVPKYTFQRPRNSSIDKAAELTSTRRSDQPVLAAIVETTAAREAQRGGRRRTKTV